MKNKKAQLFSLYLVMITLFFLGLVFLGYMQNQKNINSALTSPLEVLLIEDEQMIFEYNEEKLINELFCELKIEENFKQEFCKRIEPYSNFIKKDIYFNNQKLTESTWEKSDSWINFCESIYDIEIKNTNIVVYRKDLNKRLILDSGDLEKTQFEKVTFKTTLDYVYNKEYNLNC